MDNLKTYAEAVGSGSKGKENLGSKGKEKLSMDNLKTYAEVVGSGSKGKEKLGRKGKEKLSLIWTENYKCGKCLNSSSSMGGMVECLKKEHPVMNKRDFDNWRQDSLDGKTVEFERFPFKHNEYDLIVSTDAAFSKNSGAACLAVVLRTAKLDFIFAKGKKETKEERGRLNDRSEIAEADSIVFGIQTAINFVKEQKGRYKTIKVFNDCSVAITAYKTGRTKFPEYGNSSIPIEVVNKMRTAANEPHWEGPGNPKPTMRDTKKQEVKIMLFHIHRESNFAAHFVGSTYETHTWHEPGKILGDIVEDDRLLTRYYIVEKSGASSTE